MTPEDQGGLLARLLHEYHRGRREGKAEEREACAKASEQWPDKQNPGQGEVGKAWAAGGKCAALLIAAVIRARGNP